MFLYKNKSKLVRVKLKSFIFPYYLLRPKNLILYNWYYVTGICQFRDHCKFGGHSIGSKDKKGNIFDEEKCARSVRQMIPKARFRGATFNKQSGICYAGTGKKDVYKRLKSRCCIFPGNNSSYLLTFIF